MKLVLLSRARVNWPGLFCFHARLGVSHARFMRGKMSPKIWRIHFPSRKSKNSWIRENWSWDSWKKAYVSHCSGRGSDFPYWFRNKNLVRKSLTNFCLAVPKCFFHAWRSQNGFLMPEIAMNKCSKNHRIRMFWVFGIFSRLSGSQGYTVVKNRDHTCLRSESITGKVKTSLTIGLRLDFEMSQNFKFLRYHIFLKIVLSKCY